MGEDYFLGEVEVLGVCLLYVTLIIGFFNAAASIKLTFQEVHDVDILLMSVKLPGVYSEEELAHDIIAHEGVITVAR